LANERQIDSERPIRRIVCSRLLMRHDAGQNLEVAGVCREEKEAEEAKNVDVTWQRENSRCFRSVIFEPDWKLDVTATKYLVKRFKVLAAGTLNIKPYASNRIEIRVTPKPRSEEGERTHPSPEQRDRASIHRREAVLEPHAKLFKSTRNYA